MRFHYVCLLFLCLTSFRVAAQTSAAEETIEIGHLFDTDMDSWYEISFRCSELVPLFFERNEQDTLFYILQYWEQETNVMEPIRRVWMLNQIAQKKFNANFLSTINVDDLVDYATRVSAQKSDTLHWGEPDFFYVSAAFNRFTTSLALDLLQYNDLSDDEYLICLFYSHQFDEFWRLMNSDEARHTTLYRQVHNYKNSMDEIDAHYGFFLGYWTPRTSFTRFGEKVNVGGTLGIEWRRVIIDGTLLFQFLNSKEPYTVKYEDELFETQHYFRFYMGIEPAFKLYDWGHTRMNVVAGAGIDVLEAVPEGENPYYAEPITIAGPNLNLGIGMQHYVKKGRPWYIFYQLRYEFVGYDNEGGTDFSDGEAVSFRLGFAWDANTRKHELGQYFR